MSIVAERDNVFGTRGDRGQPRVQSSRRTPDAPRRALRYALSTRATRWTFRSLVLSRSLRTGEEGDRLINSRAERNGGIETPSHGYRDIAGPCPGSVGRGCSVLVPFRVVLIYGAPRVETGNGRAHEIRGDFRLEIMNVDCTLLRLADGSCDLRANWKIVVLIFLVGLWVYWIQDGIVLGIIRVFVL